MRFLTILSCVLLFLSPLAAQAEVPSIYYDGNPLDIHVAMGKITEVIFPDKVAKIIKGGGADSVLIQVLDSSVFILPKDATPADIYVTSVKGESYPLNLLMGNGHEAKVRVRYAFDPSFSQQDNRQDVMDLMKLLLQGRVPAGALVLDGRHEHVTGPEHIKLTLNTVFGLPTLNGLVLTAENLGDDRVVVPVEGMHYPGLLALASDADTLAPHGEQGNSTKIYMVVSK